MSFSKEIKKEILNIDRDKNQFNQFLSGILLAKKLDHFDNYEIRIKSESLMQAIKEKLDAHDIDYNMVKNNIVIENFNIEEVKDKTHFFGGVFLSGGAISDTASTSHHLELQFLSRDIATEMMDMLNASNFDFSIIDRKTTKVVYQKKVEKISDFLRAVNAFDSLLVFEHVRIERDMKNEAFRFANFDAANMERLANANAEFQQLYDLMMDKKLTHRFRKSEILFFHLKYNNPEMSLNELTELYNQNYGTIITKSGVNHWIRKLRKWVTED